MWFWAGDIGQPDLRSLEACTRSARVTRSRGGPRLRLEDDSRTILAWYGCGVVRPEAGAEGRGLGLGGYSKLVGKGGLHPARHRGTGCDVLLHVRLSIGGLKDDVGHTVCTFGEVPGIACSGYWIMMKK